MPIVANSALPSFKRFQKEGGEIISSGEVSNGEKSELHIVLMNMMPDAALEPTERQFLRLVGGCNSIAQLFVYPFSPAEIPRGIWARKHIENYYCKFEELKSEGLDALIVSGANPVFPMLTEESFWNPLCRVLDWAAQHVTSTLCACLATHAAMRYFYGIERIPLTAKRWGIFNHRVKEDHPLLLGVNSNFDVPHSRWNEITFGQMNDAGLRILVESDEAGVHLATSCDGFRFVFFQGHPEYDNNSLLKEFKREVRLYLSNNINQFPPYPEHYFSLNDMKRLKTFETAAVISKRSGSLINIDNFPEEKLRVNNTWNDAGNTIFNNWLAGIHKIGGCDRRKPLKDKVDPNKLLLYLSDV